MNSTHITALEPGNRIQLPADWATTLGLCSAVSLERTPDGILVRPAKLSWDEVFKTKLTVRSGDDSTEPDLTDLSGDDLFI